MTHADFVHLRVHSAYSLLEGALKIPDIVSLGRHEQMPAVAITDSGNLFGALEFASACAKSGIQPIIGCQLAVTREDGKTNGTAPAPDQLVVLAQTKEGYRNLLKLVSKSFLESDPGEKAQVSIADLAAYNEGLIALTAGPAGAVGRLLLEGQDAPAREMLVRLAEIYPGRLYVELMRHGMPEEAGIEPALIELAYALDLPLVATNEAFFSDDSEYEAHDALLCIAEGRTIGETERRRVTPQHRFKTAAEMTELFADLPEAIANTVVIARRCAVMPEPHDPILPAFPMADGESESRELKAQAEKGLEERLRTQVFTEAMDDDARADAGTPYRERLAFELDVIERMGYPGYFLIVADFIKWAKDHGIPVGPGRGSGAGSVVAWALTITDLDPLRWGLLFERFLNPERVSMPDFDIDFCQERRDEVIGYVQQKYGHDRVAQIITFGKLQARAVLRDVGRVMQLPYSRVDRICKLVPNNPANPVTLQQAIDGEPQLQEMRAEDAQVAHLIDIALKLEGLYRHASTHAAGLVIGDRPLDELVPLYRDPRSSMPVTQFSMKWAEEAGLVKFDFLGLKTLTVLSRAQKLLAERGVEVDFTRLPLDDAKTYEMLSKGDTTGVFQLESSGMRNLVRDAGVGTFEDIVALVALFRPGPMENIPKYIACKHGKEKPEFLHETIDPVTADTYGVIIYQEQVMQIAQVYAGFTLGHADILRKAMGKKIKSEMAAQRDAFVAGAIERGDTEDRANYVFDLVDKFAGYGFNKAHSAAYALIAYQTAYLKANHPVEFLAASMTLDMGNTDKLGVFRGELDRSGIALLPPDINRSEPEFTVEESIDRETDDGKRAIRYAFAALRNVGHQAMLDVTAEREANGPFKSVGDFVTRLDTKILNKRQMESLIAAGAFDGLDANRKRLFEGAERLLRFAHAAAEERASAQTNFFGDEGAGEGLQIDLPETPDWLQADRLRHEFEAIGFYLSAHPLEAYAEGLERLNVTGSGALREKLNGSGETVVKLAGAVIARKERTSSRGNRMSFIQLSDRNGTFEVTAFSEVLSTSREILDQALETGGAVLVTAEVRDEDDNLRITAQRIARLDEAVAQGMSGFRIYLEDDKALSNLHSLIERQSKGKGRLSVVVDAGDQEVEIALPGSFALSPATRAAIKAVAGVAQVEEVLR